MPDEPRRAFRDVVRVTCVNGHEYPAMAGECPYCNPERVEALGVDGLQRFRRREERS
jgi:hypothetical protein